MTDHNPQSTPQQRELTDAVNQLDAVLSSVIPTSTGHYAVEALRAAVRQYHNAQGFGSSVTTYDVKARETALALGEEVDES